ncbi:MAG: glutaredoxin [Armatimonadetes bacterium CSP1-3]|nr:MAG: glutaredoxin [Armatimonadetes bacterium CSP1-3]
MKEFLHQKGITFTDRDVTQDDAAFEDVMRMGFAATPVTLIDGEAVVGFNKAKLEQLLAA